MRAVVTGGAGFIGSALATALVKDGHEVVVIDSLVASDRSSVPEGATFFEIDIRDLATLQGALKVGDVIFHHAALRSVPQSLENPSLVHECNATGTLNVLIAGERAGAARLIYASSSSVYGGASEGRSQEDAAPKPLSPYGVSKLAGEYYAKIWADLGKLPTVSLRYFNVFGPGQRADSRYAAVFPSFISALRRGEGPEIHWDGEQSRDFTFIDDVVRANFLAAKADDDAVGRVINVAGGRPRTINETFEAIASALGKRVEPIRTPKRPGDIRTSFADASRARELLAWEPQVDWNDAIEATVGWFTSGPR